MNIKPCRQMCRNHEYHQTLHVLSFSKLLALVQPGRMLSGGKAIVELNLNPPALGFSIQSGMVLPNSEANTTEHDSVNIYPTAPCWELLKHSHKQSS